MTVRDVAARAGVSPATVSRVFTQPEAVAPETRQRVLAAAEELRYAPNPVARSLARRRTGNLGIVVPDIVNSFSAVVIKAVQQEARRAEYALFVAASDELADDEERWARALAPQVDGLLLASPQSPDARPPRAWPTPFRSWSPTGCSTASLPSSPSPRPPRAMPWSTCTRWATATWCTWPDPTATPTRAGSPGCTPPARRLGLGPVVLGPFPARFSSGVRAADLVLAAGATAVIAFNDDIAAGLLTRFADRGVRVPDDISVVGHDDTALAEMVTPRLTTVRIPAAADRSHRRPTADPAHPRGRRRRPPVRADVGADRAPQLRARTGLIRRIHLRNPMGSAHSLS